jgi:cell wall-associated NlpC family hydrolase
MTPADRYLAYLQAAASDHDAYKDYVWGAEGTDVDHDGDPEWDCSGLFHAALTRGAGLKDVRNTADGYMRRGHPIVRPSQLGDFRVHLNSDGHAVHIIMYVGNGKTIEAKGKAYGIDRDTVANGHGPWFRIDAVNKALGKLSATTPSVPGVLYEVTAKDLTIFETHSKTSKVKDTRHAGEHVWITNINRVLGISTGWYGGHYTIKGEVRYGWMSAQGLRKEG